MRSPCTCASKTPCPACTAYQAAERRRTGQQGPGRPVSPHARTLEKHHDALLAAYQAGERPGTLATRYGVSTESVQNYLRRHGVQENRLGSNQFRLKRGGPDAPGY